MRSHVHILTIIIGVSCFCFGFSSTDFPSYLYPVGVRVTDDGRRVVYLIHQSAPNTISLFEWDSVTKEVASILPAPFIPAGFKMLPDDSGFSFVDQGLIRIKKFAKRSPKTIESSQPIYGIMHVEWLDGATMYLSAKERERFGIFQISCKGTVERLLTSREADFRYPQKIADKLFFIEQRNDRYRFMSIDYPNISSLDVAVSGAENFEERVRLVLEQQKAAQPLLNIEQAEVLFDFGAQPVAFLFMKSPDEGFCMSYTPKLSMDDVVLTCTYFRLSCFGIGGEKNDGGKKQSWTATPLFVFDIPLELLQPGSPHRLYESILPLLPRHFGTDIYFVSQDATVTIPTLNIFSFDQKTGATHKKTSAAPGQTFFAPFLVDGNVFYGFSVVGQNVGQFDLLCVPF